jgi:hypothetical protein
MVGLDLEVGDPAVDEGSHVWVSPYAPTLPQPPLNEKSIVLII